MKSFLFVFLLLFATSFQLIAADASSDVQADIVTITEIGQKLPDIKIIPAAIDIVSPTASDTTNNAVTLEVPLVDQNSWAEHTHEIVAIDTDDWQSAQLTMKIEPPAAVTYDRAITWTEGGVTSTDFAAWQLRLDASWAQRTAKPDGVLMDRRSWQVTDDKLAQADQVDQPVAVADGSNIHTNETDAPPTVADHSVSQSEDVAVTLSTD